MNAWQTNPKGRLRGGYHLTSSSAILIFSMCTRRWFNILPRIWSPIIPESRSPISSCHFTSKEGKDPWCIHFHHAARLKLWKSFFLNILSRTFNWSQTDNLNFRYRLQNSRLFFFFSKSVQREEFHTREACEPHNGRVLASLPPFSALLKTFRLTARTYLNTQKYGLFCSLVC